MQRNPLSTQMIIYLLIKHSKTETNNYFNYLYQQNLIQVLEETNKNLLEI